ncbi:ubiquitin-specific protease doa4, partial [Coemansia erecta]
QQLQQQQESAMLMEQRKKRRAPPPVPMPQVPQVPPKPPVYAPAPETTGPPRNSAAYSTAPVPQRAQLQTASPRASMYMSSAHMPQAGFYSQPVAAGSDPSLNGRMHAGGNLRAAYQPQIAMQPDPALAQLAPVAARRASQLPDTAAYGATGLKNFGNTCFMNSVLQCLAGTGPLTRYFMRGEWKKDLNSNARGAEVSAEFARLLENMWRGQYASISPIGFRGAVGKCSEQFKGNEQEDAHEFATFLLDALHESLNHVRTRPPPERDPTPREELEFEQLSDAKQSELQWSRFTRRNWSIVTSIFQGQIQSRLTCTTCKHTSTTYHTFTELSVPIPAAAKTGAALVRKGRAAPVNIYQCLDAYSETELLDGDNKWLCPRCKTKRKATKRLMIARLPLVLIVHLKRFSTIGHFREKLETNVLVPTKRLHMQNYVIQGQHPSTMYNLYGVANHFGTLSGGHYTASVFNGLRD